jgi:carotenoid 1,2-hydratase
LSEILTISSSIADDVWHKKLSPKGYDCWYFDAVSDDRRDAVVIIFQDNYVFSPSYFKPENVICPAISFVYYHDGKPIYRFQNEFDESKLKLSQDKPFCKIGENEFKFEKADYGSGYVIKLDAVLSKNRRLKANFEWLLIESDFVQTTDSTEVLHSWNLVAPRADVTGNIEVFQRNGKLKDKIAFRGTGYHSHNFDNRCLAETIESWQWGRCHYTDATVAFIRYKEHNAQPITKLFLVRDGEYKIREANYEEQTYSRDILGLKYPNRLRFVTENNVRLRVKQEEVIDSSFFYLRFLSEMTLTLRDGKPRKMLGITEHLSPKALKWRWLDFFVNLRIGKNGKGSFLP